MSMAAKFRRALTAVVGTARESLEAERECRDALLHTDEMKRKFREQVEVVNRVLGDRTGEEGERHGRLGSHSR